MLKYLKVFLYINEKNENQKSDNSHYWNGNFVLYLSNYYCIEYQRKKPKGNNQIELDANVSLFNAQGPQFSN